MTVGGGFPAGPTCDVLVLGGGMAGVSIGAELAADRSVTVLDMEPTLAFHTTGRSAAMFLESYGGPAIRALTTSSRAELDANLRPMPNLFIGLTGHGDTITAMHREVSALVPSVELLDVAQTVELQPLLRPERIEAALFEPDAMEIDVDAVHESYLRLLRERGGHVATSARAVLAMRTAGAWTVTDAAGRHWQAPVVIDAAGAWADETAGLFGARPVGLQALRRTAFVVDAPPGARPPMFGDVPDTFYAKPEAGRLLCSPADETAQQPADARADELEIARAIEAINDTTTLDIRHVRASWAGLRTFAVDRVPVVGFDPQVPGLFWFAGQGGYGIQLAPALARTGAALVRGDGIPADVGARGLVQDALAPNRPALAQIVGSC